jgi:hypothetical protein
VGETHSLPWRSCASPDRGRISGLLHSLAVCGEMNLTLAAHYGVKPRQFANFIRWCQASVATLIPRAFRPYEVGQVHATIVGLEAHRKNGELLSDNYRKLGESRRVNLADLLELLSRTRRLPFRVRIGGFRLGDTYSFTSFGRHPYLRSFSIQPSNIVVAMGWPEARGQFPETLDGLRREFNRCNIVHKYHKTEQDIDNDFFFVLGKLESSAETNGSRGTVSETIRAQIACIEPVYVDVAWEDLSLVAYLDDELPMATSVRIPLAGANSRIAEIAALYEEAE